MKYNVDYLKPIGQIREPDPRWSGFGGIDQLGNISHLTPEHYAKPIEDIDLNDAVPEKVKVHFETAKNLALYA